jgi:nucleoside phosphorylase
MATVERTPLEAAVLAVAAERGEFAGLLRRAAAVRRLDWGLRCALEAELNGQRWVLVANGMGARLAGQAVRVALERGSYGAVVSTGYCGALEPGLRVADIVVATEVLSPAGRAPARQPHGAAAAHGPVYSAGDVAVTAASKARLHAAGGIAVEMEAGAVAPEAAARRLDFYCIRAVSDTAHNDLPLDFNRLRGADGGLARARVLGALARRPQALAGLLRLARDCRAASHSLGDFLADCRF